MYQYKKIHDPHNVMSHIINSSEEIVTLDSVIIFHCLVT